MQTTSGLRSSTSSTISLASDATGMDSTMHPPAANNCASIIPAISSASSRAGRQSTLSLDAWGVSAKLESAPVLFAVSAPCFASTSCWRSPSSSIVSFRVSRMNLCRSSSISPRRQCICATASAGINTVSKTSTRDMCSR